MNWIDKKSEIQPINLPILSEKNIQVSFLREDQLHPTVSGNKYRKLKYNLLEAKKQNIDKILTFGGAYSNHIAATAAAGKEFGFETIGIIRGEELSTKIGENPTLNLAQQNGMHLKFVTRTQYRDKEHIAFLNTLYDEFGDVFIVPEGGSNEFAVKGCEEILDERAQDFDFICCAVGTAGTISGIINTLNNNQIVLGFPALKNGDFLHNEIKKFSLNTNYELINDYNFGGYAKVTEELFNFVKYFYQETSIPLDLIYTGKMVFGLLEMIKNDYFQPFSKILIVHTGGLQGNIGFNLNF